MTSPFQQPDYTSQIASDYKAAIDHSVAVMARIAAAFACRAQTSPNMTVHLEAGAVFVNGSLTEVSGQNTSTITAPVSNPRIDRIVIDQLTGSVSVVGGTENALPTAPAIPAGKIPIARITMTPSMTSIVNADITDERVQTPAVDSRVGIVEDFAGTTAPAGTLECDGSAVSRTTYAALYSVIGITWGAGNGTTTFNLPDLRRRTTVGRGGTGTGTLGNAVGNTGGEEDHTLTIGEMPNHSHNVDRTTTGGGSTTDFERVLNSNGRTPIATSAIGGGGAHNNIQPSAVMMKVIRYR